MYELFYKYNCIIKICNVKKEKQKWNCYILLTLYLFSTQISTYKPNLIISDSCPPWQVGCGDWWRQALDEPFWRDCYWRSSPSEGEEDRQGGYCCLMWACTSTGEMEAKWKLICVMRFPVDNWFEGTSSVREWVSEWVYQSVCSNYSFYIFHYFAGDHQDCLGYGSWPWHSCGSPSQGDGEAGAPPCVQDLGKACGEGRRRSADCRQAGHRWRHQCHSSDDGVSPQLAPGNVCFWSES